MTWSRSLGCLAVISVPLYLISVYLAPVDSMQGIAQKILYVHVPCAFAAYLGFFFTGIFGAFYLGNNKRHYDHMAVASAEVGVLFCALVIVTGPIWAKATWGHWWSWDPRLTVTLLLWFIYLAYLLLRGFSAGGGLWRSRPKVLATSATRITALDPALHNVHDPRSNYAHNGPSGKRTVRSSKHQ